MFVVLEFFKIKGFRNKCFLELWDFEVFIVLAMCVFWILKPSKLQTIKLLVFLKFWVFCLLVCFVGIPKRPMFDDVKKHIAVVLRSETLVCWNYRFAFSNCCSVGVWFCPLFDFWNLQGFTTFVLDVLRC